MGTFPLHFGTSMPDKIICLRLACLTDEEILSVPLPHSPDMVRRVDAYEKSGNNMVCTRIGCHQFKVSMYGAGDKPLTSSETGDFEGSLPRATAHVLAIWSVMYGKQENTP